MANEITVNLQILINKPPFSQTYTFNDTFDQAVIGGGNPGVIDIGTSEENIVLGDIVVPSLFIVQNLDATNYVTLGVSATTPTLAAMQRIGAGKFSFGWLDPGSTLRAQANGASVKIFLAVFEA